MTAIGGRKHNATGRETGQRKVNKGGKIDWQFFPTNFLMLDSPAYRALSLAARKVLNRIEIEFGRHGGTGNGRLIVTFQDFEDYGIDRHAIKSAIAECEALGFIQITQRGRAGVGEFRKPNVFRLTYLNTPPIKPTNDWERVETIEKARALRSMAKGKRGRSAPYREDIDSSGETPTENTAA